MSEHRELTSGSSELEIVEFHLDETMSGGQAYVGYYGINVAKVLEIIREPHATELPQMSHPSVMGTFNLRGHVIPLIDLCSWLGKQMQETDAAKVVVTEFLGVVNGFRVSGVTRIHRLTWDMIEPPSQKLKSLSGDTISGVVKLENKVIFLLDMEKIVGDLNPSLAMAGAQEAIDLPDDAPRYKAMSVDDSTSVRRIIVSKLEQAGFEVTQAVDGVDAWDKLGALKALAEAEGKPITDYIQLIISDIEMPAMDGHNLTRRIKTDPVLQRVPVVLFSSIITESMRGRGLEAGADDQISKPDLPNLAGRARQLASEAVERAE